MDSKEMDLPVIVENKDSEHFGHTVQVTHTTRNCGGYEAVVSCSCGKSYGTGMNGCWQQNHQYPEWGELSLKVFAL